MTGPTQRPPPPTPSLHTPAPSGLSPWLVAGRPYVYNQSASSGQAGLLYTTGGAISCRKTLSGHHPAGQWTRYLQLIHVPPFVSGDQPCRARRAISGVPPGGGPPAPSVSLWVLATRPIRLVAPGSHQPFPSLPPGPPPDRWLGFLRPRLLCPHLIKTKKKTPERLRTSQMPKDAAMHANNVTDSTWLAFRSPPVNQKRLAVMAYRLLHIYNHKYVSYTKTYRLSY